MSLFFLPSRWKCSAITSGVAVCVKRPHIVNVWTLRRSLPHLDDPAQPLTQADGWLSSLLFHHNLVLDLLVGRSRKNLLLYQLVFPLVRTPLDDLLGVGIPDPWEGLELVGSGGVDVEEVSLPGFLSGGDNEA